MNSYFGYMLDSVLYIVWFNNQKSKPTYKTDRKNYFKQPGTLQNFPPFFCIYRIV